MARDLANVYMIQIKDSVGNTNEKLPAVRGSIYELDNVDKTNTW